MAGAAQVSQYASGGYAWSPVTRPKRKPFLEFTQDQLVQMKLPLILDGADGDQSIDYSVTLVETWRHPTTATHQPPILSIVGPVTQFGVTGWVVQQIDWSDDQTRRRDGALIQQALDLTLIEYTGSTAVPGSPTLAAQTAAILGILRASGVQIPAQLAALLEQLPNLLSSASPDVTSSITSELASFVASIPNNAAGAQVVVDSALPQLAQILPTLVGARTYVVRDGDTLARIAARELGDYRKWSLIATLNGLRDPNSLNPNDRILLP
jgi:hypothetical protein